LVAVVQPGQAPLAVISYALWRPPVPGAKRLKQRAISIFRAKMARRGRLSCTPPGPVLPTGAPRPDVPGRRGL